MIAGLSADEQRRLLMSIGTRRSVRQMSPIEVANALQRAMRAGATASDLAKALQLDSRDMITRFVRLLTLDPATQFLVDWGNTGTTLSFSAASQVARLRSDEARHELAIAALAHGLTGIELRQVIDLYERRVGDIDGAVARVIKTRPRTRTRHMLAGLLTNPAVPAALAESSQAERDALLGRVIRDDLPPLEVDSWRLGIDRFMISGGETLKRSIMQQDVDFERLISDLLAKRVAK